MNQVITRNPNGDVVDDDDFEADVQDQPKARRANPPAAGLQWPPLREDPPEPAPRGAGSAARRVVDFLLEHPGEWYRIGEFRTAQPPKGYYAEKGIEVVHRPIGDGIYARWAKAPES